MSVIKKRGAVPMTAAEITKEMPLSLLERNVILTALYAGSPTGSEEEARKSRDLYEALSKGWDWDDPKCTNVNLRDFDKAVEPKPVLTKRQVEHLRDFAKTLCGQKQGRDAFALLDVVDRANFVLTGEPEK
jgi:hypothetical protein